MPIKNQVIKSNVPITTVPQSHVYLGFSSSNKKGSFKLYDDTLIKADILNAFNTRKGERPMNPTYGTIIWDTIFEPMTDDVKVSIQDDIKAILNGDPRIATQGVVVNQYATGIIIEITLQIKATSQITTMKLDFNSKSGLTLQ
jgi:phage baseplate assembly protein W